MILLDTHVVVWLAGDPDRLSRTAARAIAKARKVGGGLAISAFTLFELGHLVVRKRIDVEMPVESFLEDMESRFVVLPLNGRIAARAAQMPATFPGDPMDRIIGATALVEGMSLVTADRAIQQSGILKTIW